VLLIVQTVCKLLKVCEQVYDMVVGSSQQFKAARKLGVSVTSCQQNSIVANCLQLSAAVCRATYFGTGLVLGLVLVKKSKKKKTRIWLWSFPACMIPRAQNGQKPANETSWMLLESAAILGHVIFWRSNQMHVFLVPMRYCG
jgi:hypothetical protein